MTWIVAFAEEKWVGTGMYGRSGAMFSNVGFFFGSVKSSEFRSIGIVLALISLGYGSWMQMMFGVLFRARLDVRFTIRLGSDPAPEVGMLRSLVHAPERYSIAA